MVALMVWPVFEGKSPKVPGATWAFCARMAVLTSLADKFKPCNLAGSIHTRMAFSEPNTCTLPMPSIRCNSGWTLREM